MSATATDCTEFPSPYSGISVEIEPYTAYDYPNLNRDSNRSQAIHQNSRQVDMPRRSAWSRWYVRVPLKWLMFIAVTTLTLFPYPSLLFRQISRLSNLEAMVSPDAPELADFETALRFRLHAKQERDRAKAEGREITHVRDLRLHDIAELRQAQAVSKTNDVTARGETESIPHPREPNLDIPIAADLSAFRPSEVQKAVERLIYEEVLYDWDWNIWGVADYMPTIAEMFERARLYPDGMLREDCDGRAVMAASLMRRLGYDSRLVTDMRHVWVTTPQGQWMGPGRSTTVRSTPRGNVFSISTALMNAPAALSYGVSVFPLPRELIIAAAAFLLLLNRRMSVRAAMFGGLLLLQGLLFMRLGHVDPLGGSQSREWPAWVGLLHILAGMAMLLYHGRAARRLERDGSEVP